MGFQERRVHVDLRDPEGGQVQPQRHRVGGQLQDDPQPRLQAAQVHPGQLSLRRFPDQDQQWQEEYFQKILPWLQHQDNMALRSLLPPTTMADPGEAWELWQLDFSGGGNWEKQLVDLAHHLEQEVDGAKLGGVFSSVFGPIKTGVVLWQHKLLDDTPALQESLAKSDKGGALMKKVGRKESKILAATPFSPWQ